MKNIVVKLAAVAFLMGVLGINAAFAQTETTTTTTTTVTTQVVSEPVFKIDITEIRHPMTDFQRAKLERILRVVQAEQRLAVGEFDEDANEPREGEMVMVHYDESLDEDHGIDEALPIRDDNENRVRVKIEEDGDVEWEYFEDDDARGIIVDYDEDDKEIIIEYDYAKRTLNNMVNVLALPADID